MQEPADVSIPFPPPPSPLRKFTFSLNARRACPGSCALAALPFLRRCFFIAQSYVLVKKWSEALVLYGRVLKYAGEVSADAGAFRSSLKVGPGVPPGQHGTAGSGPEEHQVREAKPFLRMR